MSDWSAEVEEDFERRSQVVFIFTLTRYTMQFIDRLVLPWIGVPLSLHLLIPDTIPLQEEEWTGAHRLQEALSAA